MAGRTHDGTRRGPRRRVHHPDAAGVPRARADLPTRRAVRSRASDSSSANVVAGNGRRQLWQTRPRSKGVHVDENWHEFGDLPFDIAADVELTEAAMPRTAEFGVRSKGVNYDAFPVDTGTIVANDFLNPGGKLPLVMTSNNIYHDWDTTMKLGECLVRCADELGRSDSQRHAALRRRH